MVMIIMICILRLSTSSCLLVCFSSFFKFTRNHISFASHRFYNFSFSQLSCFSPFSYRKKNSLVRSCFPFIRILNCFSLYFTFSSLVRAFTHHGVHSSVFS